MKKLALTSLVALFAISTAHAGQYYVGGSASLRAEKDGHTVYGIAPEFGYHLNDKWDLGFEVGFAKDMTIINSVEADRRAFSISPYARYTAAQFGDFKVLFKGAVDADFTRYSAGEDVEWATSFGASIVPMVTYDLSESFTLHATLNFLGVYANTNLKNDDLALDSDWSFGFGANANNVLNTKDFQVGFTYSF